LLLAILFVGALGALASASARAASGYELREVSKITYGSPEDGGEISTVYNADNRRANEIARTASDPDRHRLFLVTRPYTDGTVRVFRVDLPDGTSAQRLPQATIQARANFAATRNAAVDPTDGHLWVIVQDAANLPRLIWVDPDSGAILANLALPTTANNVMTGPMRIDPDGDRLWLSGGQYIANVPLATARAEGATEATFQISSLRQRPLYSLGTFPGIQPSAAGVAFADDDRDQGSGRTGPWTYVATAGPAGLLWISNQTAADLANTALPVNATPAISPDNGRSEGTARSMAVDPDSGDILQAIETPNDGNFGRIVRLARDTRTPATTAAPGVATPQNGQFRFDGDEVWWRGPGETMILDRTTLEPRVTVPNPPGTVPAESEQLFDDRLYAPVSDGVSVREMTEVEIPDANATPISGRRITGGTIEWGVRQSWRQYITAGVAAGRVDLTAPASAPDGADPTGPGYAYRFAEGQGVYDPEKDELRLTTKGGVRFTGHYAGATPLLDVRFADPTVIVRRDGTALLTATGRDSEGNDLGNWPFVDLDVTAVAVTHDGETRTVTYTAAPTTLRGDGQSIFQGNYPTGSAFDPITFSLTYHESEAATWDPAMTPQTRNGVPVNPDDPGPGPGPESGPEIPAPTPPLPSPLVSPLPVPEAKGPAARINLGKANQRLGRDRTARLGTLACPSVAPCKVVGRKRARVTVAGESFGAPVLVPRWIAAGKRAQLRVRLSKGAAKRLEGRKAVVRVKVTVLANGDQTVRTLRVVVRR